MHKCRGFPCSISSIRKQKGMATLFLALHLQALSVRGHHFLYKRRHHSYLGLKRYSGENKILMANLKGGGNNKTHQRSIDPNSLTVRAFRHFPLGEGRGSYKAPWVRACLKWLTGKTVPLRWARYICLNFPKNHLGKSSMSSTQWLDFLSNHSSGKNCAREDAWLHWFFEKSNFLKNLFFQGIQMSKKSTGSAHRLK